MSSPRILIVRAPGTNCDEETAHAFKRAGGEPIVEHVNRIIEDPGCLAQYQILCFPGGFSYGDDVAAGRILASQLRHQLMDVLFEFRESEKLILGICNGFQILLKTHDVERSSDSTSTFEGGIIIIIIAKQNLEKNHHYHRGGIK